MSDDATASVAVPDGPYAAAAQFCGGAAIVVDGSAVQVLRDRMYRSGVHVVGFADMKPGD